MTTSVVPLLKQTEYLNTKQNKQTTTPPSPQKHAGPRISNLIKYKHDKLSEHYGTTAQPR